jgi:hypothetical protein
MMKRFLIALALVAISMLGYTVGPALAGAVTPLTGPAGTNPAAVPNNLGDYNTIINNLNAAISNGAALGTNTGVFTGSTFQIPGTSKTGSMSLGTIQPGNAGLSTLGSLTVKFFINIVDSVGNNAYIPVWE